MAEQEVAWMTTGAPLTKKNVEHHENPLPPLRTRRHRHKHVIPPTHHIKNSYVKAYGDLLKETDSDGEGSKDTPRKRPRHGSVSDTSGKASEDRVSWVTFGSPLWHKDAVQGNIKPLPPLWKQRQMEKGFVNDGVKTYMSLRARRKPIIPPYNAVKDKYAQAYFQSPLVKAVLDRSMEKALAMKRQAEQEDVRQYNKMSYNRRCKTSPTVEQIRARESFFVNDAIITEKLRTKYKDIIPKYDASDDRNCRRYFTRPDVQRLVSVTCSARK